MYKRPAGLFLSAFLVLIAGFALLRPLLRGVLPDVLGPSVTAGLLILLGLSVLLEVILLLQMRPAAAKAALVICTMWLAVICTRVLMALQFSPAIFGPGLTGGRAYIAPAIASMLCVANIIYLGRADFRQRCVQYREQRQNYNRNLEKRLLERM